MITQEQKELKPISSQWLFQANGLLASWIAEILSPRQLRQVLVIFDASLTPHSLWSHDGHA
eukprot:6060005-Amphidinium_carterae.1